MTALPDKLTETPHSYACEGQLDVLTDILSSLRLTGGVVVDGEMSGDFCLLSHFNDEDCEHFQLRADELIAYHYVRAGRLYASVDGSRRSLPRPATSSFCPATTRICCTAGRGCSRSIHTV